MEKISAGYNYVSGDWPYSMIRPDGAVLGATGGRSLSELNTVLLAIYFVPTRIMCTLIPKNSALKTNPIPNSRNLGLRSLA